MRIVKLLDPIPFPYRLAAIAALAVVLIGFGWIKGAGHVQDEWDAANAKQATQVIIVKQRQAAETVRVITQYIDRIKVVRETAAAIVKKVPVYVSPEADTACVLPVGFVRLHDAAAADSLPGPAGVTDAAPAGIALSTATSTIADNYRRCHENAEQLTALQAWAVAMKTAATERNP